MNSYNGVLEADDGCVLTNGKIYTTKVYLSPYDNENNWQEIPEDEIPEIVEEEEEELPEQIDYETPLKILLGME